MHSFLDHPRVILIDEVIDVVKIYINRGRLCLCFFSFLDPPLIIVLHLSHFPAYLDLDSLSKTLTRAIMADLASATLVLAFSY